MGEGKKNKNRKLNRFATFSSSYEGLQTSASSVGPFEPHSEVIRAMICLTERVTYINEIEK